MGAESSGSPGGSSSPRGAETPMDSHSGQASWPDLATAWVGSKGLLVLGQHQPHSETVSLCLPKPAPLCSSDGSTPIMTLLVECVVL